MDGLEMSTDEESNRSDNDWCQPVANRRRSMTENQRSSGGSGSVSSTAAQEKTNHQHYLNEFRVDSCPLFKQHQCQQHRPFTCFKWHFANQRRRKPIRKSDGSFNYSPDIYCDKYDENTGICPEGDECIYLHRVSGDVERKYHLRYYKTAQCVHPTDARGQCVKNGAHCAFAHTSTDLRQPMFDQHEVGFSTVIDGDGRDKTSFVIEDPQWHSQDHVLSCYKTEQCRKPARLCRQGYACPFYHNSKDRRRPPAVFKYRSTPCPAAKTIDEWLDPDICEAGDNCQYCHTRTEQQFHPEIYKSTKCNDMLEHGYCPRAVFCAFAHHDSELHASRNPYIGSTQASPKEQCSPCQSGNISASNEQLRFDSPQNGAAPSYSAVLKQRQPPISTNKPFATTDSLSSSYPKAPGYERGPMSVTGFDAQRNDQTGRFRTHSLNIGHLDMLQRNLVLNGGLTAIDNTLASQASLCRSDSGFNVVTEASLGTLEELSLDLPPIDERFNLFQNMSPMRNQNPELFANPSFFGQQNGQLSSPVQNEYFQNSFDPNMFGSDLQNGQDYDEMNRSSADDELKKVKSDCEFWKSRAEQFMNERNRLADQLNDLQIHYGSQSYIQPQLQPMSSPLAINPGAESNMDGVIRPSASLQHSPPYNIFGNDCDAAAPACARCGRDRSRSGSDSQSSCPVCSN
ncbi:unnamed protein product [Caenorhabditis angaria]|uniref:C3H1-type domain-containing protein n=1 Tax=Caenorhabditis angaria TaxID=860376 RepID=A0A9P1J2Y7_9PELO|nr:unnamed protein product [Caenorhabditis angaria]